MAEVLGAIPWERREQLQDLPDDVKRKTMVHWVRRDGSLELASMYIIDPRCKKQSNHLNLNAGVPLFENFFYAWAYWYKLYGHTGQQPKLVHT